VDCFTTAAPYETGARGLATLREAAKKKRGGKETSNPDNFFYSRTREAPKMFFLERSNRDEEA